MNKLQKKILGGAAAAAAVLALTACLLPTGNGDGLSPSGDALTPDTNYTVVRNLVFSQAGCLGCHGASPTGDAMNLSSATTAQATLFGAGGANRLTTTAQALNPRWRIYRTSDSTGIADSSYLYVKVASTTPKNGDRMPLNRAPLTADQIKIIRRWIETGAKF
jgi:hypothetical protein